MDHVRKGTGQSKFIYIELEEENKRLKIESESNEKEFADMYNKLHAENVKIKAEIITLRLENLEFIGIKSKLDKILTCDECDVPFKNKTDFTEHILMKHKVNKLKCPICGECFKTDGDVKMHIKADHELNVFKCEKCKECCKTKIDLQMHMKTKHFKMNEKESILKYENELCSKINRQKSRIHKSLFILKKEETRDYSRCKCKRRYCKINHARYSWSATKSDQYYSQMNLIEEKSLITENNQENLHNKKPNNFWCKICDREFGNLTAFKKHNEIKHKSN